MCGFLAIFLLAGAFGIEAWPFSGFRLFSRIRTGQVVGWEATTVDASGVERPIDFGDRSWLHVAAGLPELPENERMAVCRAWVAETGVVVRLYRTWAPIEGGAPRRELRASCAL